MAVQNSNSAMGRAQSSDSDRQGGGRGRRVWHDRHHAQDRQAEGRLAQVAAVDEERTHCSARACEAWRLGGVQGRRAGRLGEVWWVEAAVGWNAQRSACRDETAEVGGASGLDREELWRDDAEVLLVVSCGNTD
jgi:hypothetical protein